MSQSMSREAEIAAVYDRHANMLYRVAMSHLNNSEDAQDAVQDVFARYISAAPAFPNEEQEKAWLIRVTVNRSLDILRQKKVRSYVPLEEAGEIAAEAEEDGLHSLLHTLTHLPEKHRSAIVLHHLEGFSVEKTAELLGISVSAVKMRLSRGREALKELLQEGKRHVH